MATKIDKVTPHRKGERVVAACDLGTVPEGTTGRVRVVNGMTWLRYWVQFDNGEWLGNVDHANLIRRSEWEQFKLDRARKAEEVTAPSELAATAAEPAAGDGASTAAPSSGPSIPAHLLERSKKAKERQGQG